jgi:hypothetical protein
VSILCEHFHLRLLDFDAPDAHSLRWSSAERFGNMIVVAREIAYLLVTERAPPAA